MRTLVDRRAALACDTGQDSETSERSGLVQRANLKHITIL
jgi:hypothetical protein